MKSSRRKTPLQSDAASLNAWTAKKAAEHAAALATEGDTNAAIDILRDVAEAIELSNERAWVGPIPWPYARYLATAFRAIVNNDTPDAAHALGIKQRRAGRPRGTRTHSKLQLAARYVLLVRHERKAKGAITLLQKTTGADRRTIQRAATSYPDLKKLDDELLKAIATTPALTLDQ